MFFCFCFLFPNTVLDYDRAAGVLSYGHITVKAPHPIRTAKLSIVELDQYFGRGLQGNLQCCRAFVLDFVRGLQELRGVPARTGPVSYGHITVKAPHPIRTAKLSTVELDQYFGRGLQGNLQCCRAFVFIFLVFTRCTCLGSNHGGLRVNGSVSQINFQKFC